MGQVSLRGIRKSYGPVDVIRGIDLDVQDGEFMVFVGPSGCGKSTPLRMIAGLEAISAGCGLGGGSSHAPACTAWGCTDGLGCCEVGSGGHSGPGAALT